MDMTREQVGHRIVKIGPVGSEDASGLGIVSEERLFTTASHLPNSLHVVAPGAHGVGGECIQSIIDAFLNTGSAAGIETDCVEDIKLAPFVLR